MGIVVAPGVAVSLSQLAGENVQQIIDLGALAVPAWQAAIMISANGVLRPTMPNQTGFWYQTSVEGQTGDVEPTWNTTAGGTTTDGSISWTTLVPPGTSGDSIQSVTWVQQSPPDAELLITNTSSTQFTATAFIGGGTATYQYAVNVTLTMKSGNIYIVPLSITIT